MREVYGRETQCQNPNFLYTSAATVFSYDFHILLSIPTIIVLYYFNSPKVNTADLTASLECTQRLLKLVATGAEAALWFTRAAR